MCVCWTLPGLGCHEVSACVAVDVVFNNSNKNPWDAIRPVYLYLLQRRKSVLCMETHLPHSHFFFPKQDRTISCNVNFQDLFAVENLLNKIKDRANLNNILERKIGSGMEKLPSHCYLERRAVW